MNQGTTTERLFAYDGWKLLGEYDTSGTAQQETVWLDNLPVVTIQSGTIYNVFPDQLGTPRVITNAANTEVWKWDSDPFGTTPANDDPDGDGVKFSYNLRLPGQYFDAETGKHYNTFRDYDPGTGRYVESDPIGLGGGTNTYSYAKGSPLKNYDPFGLWSTEAHNYIIEAFIHKYMPNASPEFVNAMKAGSEHADSLTRGYQGDDYSYMHAMSSNTLSKSDACIMMNRFIKSKLDWYHWYMSGNSIDRAGEALGMAMHSIMDSTSPAHAGFKKWDSSDMFEHGPWPSSLENLEEVKKHPELVEQAISEMNNALNGNIKDYCQCSNQ